MKPIKTKELSQSASIAVINSEQIIKQSILTTIFFGILFAALLVFMTGCSDDNSVTNNNGNGSGNDNVTMSVKADESATDNPALIITEAKALVTEVELETEPSGSSQYVRISPFVIYFNMQGTLISVTSGTLPAGNYNKIKFQLHKPEDTEPISDPEFRTGTSGNQRYSFIVKGTYNGNPFVFRSRRSANLVINFNTMINLQQSERNITVLVNPAKWFNNGALDPSNPNNEDTINDNIKNSFVRAFRDDNRDGRPDDNP